MILNILIGISGSGKSTYAKKLQEKETNYIIVSTDTIRKDLYGNETIQFNNDKVFQIAYNQILDAIKNNKDVIFDATNLLRKHRKSLIDRARAVSEELKVIETFILAPIEECIIHQSMRDRQVPEKIILRQAMNFQIPEPDERYDKIIIENYITQDYVYGLLQSTWDFDQKTKWHNYPLNQHLLRTYRIALFSKYGDDVLNVTMLHDIGKLFAQTIDKNGEAHYLGHAGISAYIYFAYMNYLNIGLDDILYRTALIEHHMDWYFKSYGSIQILGDIWGNNFLEDLENLHRADKEAAK